MLTPSPSPPNSPLSLSLFAHLSTMREASSPWPTKAPTPTAHSSSSHTARRRTWTASSPSLAGAHTQAAALIPHTTPQTRIRAGGGGVTHERPVVVVAAVVAYKITSNTLVHVMHPLCLVLATTMISSPSHAHRVIDGFDTLEALEKTPVKGKKCRPEVQIRIRSVTIHANPIAEAAT